MSPWKLALPNFWNSWLIHFTCRVTNPSTNRSQDFSFISCDIRDYPIDHLSLLFSLLFSSGVIEGWRVIRSFPPQQKIKYEKSRHHYMSFRNSAKFFISNLGKFRWIPTAVLSLSNIMFFTYDVHFWGVNSKIFKIRI